MERQPERFKRARQIGLGHTQSLPHACHALTEIALPHNNTGEDRLRCDIGSVFAFIVHAANRTTFCRC